MSKIFDRYFDVTNKEQKLFIHFLWHFYNFSFLISGIDKNDEIGLHFCSEDRIGKNKNKTGGLSRNYIYYFNNK